MKRSGRRMIAAIAAFLLCAMLLLPGCKAREAASPDASVGGEGAPRYQTLAELAGKKIAVMAGSVQEQRIRDNIRDPQMVYVQSQADALMAVASGHADAMLIANASFQAAQASAPTLTRMSETIADQDGVCMAFPKTERGAMLRDQFNVLIAELRVDGTLEKWNALWSDTAAAPPGR